jgi:hypothetical protein
MQRRHSLHAESQALDVLHEIGRPNPSRVRDETARIACSPPMARTASSKTVGRWASADADDRVRQMPTRERIGFPGLLKNGDDIRCENTEYRRKPHGTPVASRSLF